MAIYLIFTLLILVANVLNHIGEREGKMETMEPMAGMLMGLLAIPVFCTALPLWLARREGLPVSKAVLRCAAGAAGLYGVATKPKARGRGLARTLTLEAFRAAREAGYHLAVLHSTPMAQSLYAKLGFRPLAPFKVFASQPFHL